MDQQEPATRWLAAGAVDVGVVAGGTIALALTLAERFRVVERVDGRSIFSEADQARINQIDEGFNRAIRIGDSVFTLSGSGWWLTMISLVGLTALMFFVLPNRLGRRTPGRLLLGLPQPTRPAPPTEPLEILAKVDQASPTETVDITVPVPVSGPAPIANAGAAAEAVADEVVDDRLAPVLEPAPTPAPETAATTPSTATATETETAIEEVAAADDVLDVPVGLSESPVQSPQPTPAPRMTLGDSDEYLSWDRSQAVTARSAVADPARSPRFDALALPESSLADNPIHASVVSSNSTDLHSTGLTSTDLHATGLTSAESDQTGKDPVDEGGPAPGQSPTWSDEWNAWVYRDPKSNRWFRHDTTVDRWKPIG